MRLYNGDCLDVMDRLIFKGIKVDMILTDPPYGTTACKWDSVIPFDEMWKRLNLLIKDNGVVVLFGSEPFSSQLRCSNLKNYKYDWVWKKTKESNFLLLKKQPRKLMENILVFYKKQPTYNPIMEKSEVNRSGYKGGIKTSNLFSFKDNIGERVYKDSGFRYPSCFLEYSNQSKELNNTVRLHPTQKPVGLLEYLIKTYTNENELVLDFTMGSGSTGVACKNTNRNFIGIELDEKYFEIAKSRIENTLVNTENKENLELW